MAAVLGVLGTVGGIISGAFNLFVETVGPMSVFLFLGAFLGLLSTFLWFFFRWLDMRGVFLPVVVFSLFFVLFLSSGALLILQDSGAVGGAAGASSAEIAAEMIAPEAEPV